MVNIQKPVGDEFVLPVKHRVQLDNTGGQGFRECFLTSATMLADYLLDGELTRRAKEAGDAEPEDAYARVLQRFGDTTDWGAQIKALAQFGIEAYSSRSASIQDVVNSLYQGIPVIIGTAYKASGHIVLVVGRNKGGLVALCPNGIRQGATNGWIKKFYSEADAEPDQFSWRLLKQVFTDLGDEAGWAVFVTGVNGAATGVREGL